MKDIYEKIIKNYNNKELIIKNYNNKELANPKTLKKAEYLRHSKRN